MTSSASQTRLDLSGRRILITGSSSGIGAATAKLAASRGAAVAIHGRSKAGAAREVQRAIEEEGGRAVLLDGDLQDAVVRRELVSAAIAALGGLDGLVNNAGGVVAGMGILEMTEEAWESAFALNAHAPFFLARDAFAHMSKSGGGRIVNVSSIGVKYGGSSQSLHYAAAKSALETVTRGLAKAGARHGVLVNAVRPGLTETPAVRGMTAEALGRRVGLIPLKRIGQAYEIAEMIAFLLSPAASFITGQTFAVSGGD